MLIPAAMASLQRGKTKTAFNQLGAFINKVEAQSGKKISEEDAGMLILFAQNIMATP